VQYRWWRSDSCASITKRAVAAIMGFNVAGQQKSRHGSGTCRDVRRLSLDRFGTFWDIMAWHGNAAWPSVVACARRATLANTGSVYSKEAIT
jgi:hypothetical protein